MAEINSNDLEKWFDEQYFIDNPQQRSDYDGLDDAGKQAFRDRIIEEERNRRNNEATDTNETPDNQDSDASQEELRDRSLTSDANEFEVDKLRIETLQDMGKLSAEDVADLTPQKAIEIINTQIPELSDEELKDMESRLTSKILDSENQEIFNTIPPKLLAQKYEEINETLSSENASEEEKQLATTRKEKLAKRIDDLTDQLVDKGQTQDGFFFVDSTNIADVKDGYDAMFEARSKDLTQTAENTEEGELTPEREAAQKQLAKISEGAQNLEEAMNRYEEEHHIADLTPENAEDLDKRFEQIQEVFNDITLDDETMRLVSNFKFTNETGELEPQFEFEDASGNKVQSHEIPEGAKNVKIIEGSKLDIAVQLAKQDAMMDTLGTDEEITKETLQEKLGNSMTETLFSMHTTSQTVDGILENPNQFTNPQYLEEFKQNLANPEKPMKVGPIAFEAGVDNIVNQTAGYATALANKIGREKPIVTNLFRPIENVDKRAADRSDTSNPSKKDVRIEMLKRSVKGFATAFVVSGAITTLGTMAATDASLTAATGGLNKLAGMAAGVGLATYMTLKQLKAWNKKQTAEGKPKGFLNRCKQLLKDRKMLMTLGTTALGATALGFAATGNPGAASALGMGALALGTANGVINNYQDCKKNGLGTLEACGWGAVAAASTIAGGFAGRETANAAIDYFNSKFPNNELFQHKEINRTSETKYSRQFEEGTNEASEKTLRTMFTDENGKFHEAELKAKIDGNLKFIDENSKIFQDRGYDLNDPVQKLALAEKMELTKIALGENTGINTAQHIDGGGVKFSHGDHYTMTDKVLASHGLADPAQAKADFMDMFNSNDADAIARGMNSFEKINADILSKYNEVSYSDNQTMAGSHNDGVLHQNAVLGEDGKLHADWEKGTEYNTYAVGDGTLNIKTELHTIETSEMVRNETDLGLGTYGVSGNYLNPMKKLKDRIGAFADKILGRKKKEEDDDIVVIPEEEKEDDDIVVIPEEEKEDDDIVVIPEEEKEDDDIVVIPEKEKEDDKYAYGKLLADEYKIVYGVDPKVVDDENDKNAHNRYLHWISYNDRVEEERKATGRDIEMYDFLTERREKFDKIFNGLSNEHYTTFGSQVKIENGEPVMDKYGHEVTVPVQIRTKDDYEKHSDTPGTAVIVAQARESVMKSNITTENYLGKMTLSHFTDYAKHYVDSDEYVGAGTRDIRKNPSFKRPCFRKGEESTSELNNSEYKVMDLNGYYFDDVGPNASKAREDFHTVNAVDNGLQLALYEIRDNHYPEEHNKVNFLKTLERREKAAMERRKNRSR